MSQPINRYAVNGLTGQFSDPDIESAFRNAIKSRVRVESRLVLLLVSFVVGMFAISDYQLVGLTREFYLLITMRIVVVSFCLFFAFVLGRWGGYSRRVWLHALTPWVLAIGIILIVPLRPDSLATQVVAVVVASMALYLLIPNLLTVATFVSLFLNIGFLVAAVMFANLSPEGTIRIALLLIMTNVVGYFALRRLEMLQRQQFALLNEEQCRNRDLLKEISHRKSLEAQLRMVAERDALTGLDSRSHFMKRAEALLQRAQHDNLPFSLFMIDVDHFKVINDTWGHTRGDYVLKQISAVCEQSLRPIDVIGRFGGEEFVVALPNTSPKAAEKLAEHLKKNVADLRLEGDMEELRLSITVGIAISQNGEADLEAMISRADKMLYIGKREGRNRVVMDLS